MNKTIQAVELLLSDSRGIYIPRDFVTDVLGINVNPDEPCEIDGGYLVEYHRDELGVWGLIEHADSVAGCLNPDDEWYWDSWSEITDNAVHAEHGHTLYQDGDLWAINVDKMTWEEKENFGFEIEGNTCVTCGGEMEPVTRSCVPLSPQYSEHQTICDGCFESLKNQPEHYEISSNTDDRLNEFSTSTCDNCNSTLGGERYLCGHAVWQILIDGKGRNHYGVHYNSICIDCFDEINGVAEH